jgi:hypothetical protein
MVSLAKLLRIRQGIRKKYKNIELENFLLSIGKFKIYLLEHVGRYVLEYSITKIEMGRFHFFLYSSLVKLTQKKFTSIGTPFSHLQPAEFI